jgi:3-methyladenine DNA glycosylase AlkD
MPQDTEEVVAEVARRLRDAGDADDAEKMAAYMKTDMPFYGVKAKPRDKIMRDAVADLDVDTRDEYIELVTAFWNQPHREEKYIAVRLARRYRRFIDTESLPLYEQMIREGAWWDFVDEIAAHLVGRVLEESPDVVWPTLDTWIADKDLWIRRAAMLAQLRLGEKTDESKLFDYALRLADEDEFFIRKAIGWALREYARKAPAHVTAFLEAHREALSALTLREASKHLDDFDA